MLRVVLPADTENTFILSLGHSWTALQESAICTKQTLGWEYSMLTSFTTHSSFTMSVMSGSCSLPSLKWSQWTVLVGYLTMSTNVSRYQTHCRQQYYLPFSNTAHACTSAWCVQHCSTAAVPNSTLFLLSYGPQQARVELN